MNETTKNFTRNQVHYILSALLVLINLFSLGMGEAPKEDLKTARGLMIQINQYNSLTEKVNALISNETYVESASEWESVYNQAQSLSSTVENLYVKEEEMRLKNRLLHSSNRLVEVTETGFKLSDNAFLYSDSEEFSLFTDTVEQLKDEHDTLKLAMEGEYKELSLRTNALPLTAAVIVPYTLPVKLQNAILDKQLSDQKAAQEKALEEQRKAEEEKRRAEEAEQARIVAEQAQIQAEEAQREAALRSFYTESESTKSSASSYIANRNTGKVHVSTCRYVRSMSEKNKIYLEDPSGYDGCKVCHPFR